MIGRIGEILKSQLQAIAIQDLQLGGLVESAYDKDNVYPRGCDDQVQCGADPGTNIYIPHDSTEAVMYFHTCEVEISGKQGPKRTKITGSFSIKLSAWINGNKITVAGACYTADTLSIDASARLFGTHVGPDGTIVTVQKIRLSSAPEQFGPFTYIESAKKRGVFQKKHGHFTAIISGTLELSPVCQPAPIYQEVIPC